MINKPSILIVEDEQDIRDLMKLHLTREGFDVVAVDNGEAVPSEIEKRSFNLAVLDWMLPGISGLDLCRRYGGKLPILMVTARAETSDIVLGLGVGADDYITKPFELPVFIARVAALLRRGSIQASASHSTQIKVGDVVIDEESHEATVNNAKVHFTPLEFKLLAKLLKSAGKVLARDRLIDEIQGEDIVVTERTIDVHIHAVRKKLGACSDLIETIRGIGYRVQIR